MPGTKPKALVLVCVCLAFAAIWFAIASKQPPSDPAGGMPEITATPESRAGAPDAAHSRRELKSFIHAPEFTLKSVDLYLSQNDVAVLVDMLGDPRYKNDWGRLSNVLAHLDEGTQAQHAIIHLIQRGDVWPRGDRALRDLVWAKISAVAALGHTNGDIARATARDALTESGALKLAQEWIGRELPGQFESNPDRLLVVIRGRAAMGLVYGSDNEGIQLIEDLYESVAPRSRKQREHQRQNSLGFYDLTLEEQNLDGLYSELVSALATRDLINDVGYDQFLTLSGDPEMLFHAVADYLGKYRVNKR